MFDCEIGIVKDRCFSIPKVTIKYGFSAAGTGTFLNPAQSELFGVYSVLLMQNVAEVRNNSGQNGMVCARTSPIAG